MTTLLNDKPIEGHFVVPEHVVSHRARVTHTATFDAEGTLRLTDAAVDVYDQNDKYIGTAAITEELSVGTRWTKASEPTLRWEDVPSGASWDTAREMPDFVERDGRGRYGIDLDVYVPHPEREGYLQRERRRTHAEVSEAISWFLEFRGYARKMESYGPWDFDEECERVESAAELPGAREIAVYTVTGGSEGHWIHVDIHYRVGEGAAQRIERRMIYLCKILGQGMPWCYRVCGELAEFIGA